MYLPQQIAPQLSSDRKTLSNGTFIKAIVVDPTPKAYHRRVPSPINLLTAAATASATFSIAYIPDGGTDKWGTECYAFPEDAKTAFNVAANIWANIISSSVPITIQACWGELGAFNPVLGSSGGGPLSRNFSGSGAVRPDTWYSAALANALHGSDLDPTAFDMHITYNSNYNWYLGTSGETPANAFDLLTVVLHEIAHGLNFSGSMNFSSETGEASWGYGTDDPNIYDVLIKDGSGRQLIDTTAYPLPSVSLADALRSDDIWFHGTAAMAENDRQPVKIYAPATWTPGSSYSHLDDTTFSDTPNALMVYAIGRGESIHDPGRVTRGLLRDLGWPLAVNQPDLIITHSSVSGSTLTANQPFTIYATAKNQGVASADSTTMRYYLSSNSTISTSDTELTTHVVISLAAGSTSIGNASVTAPDTDGTYWFGACIDSVVNESVVSNQCSDGVMITVATPDRPDLVCSIAVNDTTLTPGQSFTILATAINQGMGTSETSTMRYLLSSVEFDTDTVPSLIPGAISRMTATTTAPTTEGSYYLRAIIDPVVNESSTSNFSNEVRITVSNENGLPTVTTEDITSIDTLTATGNGTITSLGDSDLTQHGVCWHRYRNPTTADSCTSQGNLALAGSFTSSMTGLSYDSSYYVRAYAINSFGTAYGLNQFFRTRDPEMPTVITEDATDINTTSATGHGTITSLGDSKLSEHGICWSTHWNPTTADTCTTHGPVSATGSFSSSITGLSPNTSYYVRAYVINTYETVYGSRLNFTTGKEPYPWKMLLPAILLRRTPAPQPDPE
ncbi:MAG: hypothetical protein K9K37_08340 [Desulfocapsa sp.]|nr:hypothetical protein [Desulfocapsa sp.]